MMLADVYGQGRAPEPGQPAASARPALAPAASSARAIASSAVARIATGGRRRRGIIAIEHIWTADVALCRGERRGVIAAGGCLEDALGRARGESRTSARRRGDHTPRGGRAVALVADDVQRTVLDLVVDATDVLADHAERDQLDAAQQQDGDRDRAESGQV